MDDRLGYVSKDEDTASEKRCKGETDPRNNDTYAPQFENVSECAKQCTLKEPNHLLQTEKASGDSQVSYKAAEMENESVKVEKMAVSADDAANHVEEPVPFEVEQHGQTLTSIKDGRLYPTLDSIPRGIQCTGKDVKSSMWF